MAGQVAALFRGYRARVQGAQARAPDTEEMEQQLEALQLRLKAATMALAKV